MIGWPLILGITMVLVLRWRDIDDVYVIAIVGLTPFLLAPLLVADLAAWFSRSLTLQIAAAVITAACLFTIAPFDAIIGCQPSSGEGEITIMTANVKSGAGRPDAIAANIAATDPDVIVLQETKTPFMRALAANAGMEAWPYRSNEIPEANNGTVVWSKWPLSDAHADALPVNSSVEAVVESPRGDFTVASIHTASPTSPRKVDMWHEQLEGLAGLPTGSPMVIGGDFNATEDHQPFRRLLDQGWTDVHDDKGCGPDLTWSSRRLSTPVMRLDHILVTDDFEVLSTEIGDAGGSDHRPVISRIRFAGE